MTAPATRFTSRRKAKVRLDVHIDEPLLDRLAAFGNAKGWHMAETVRVCLERGLDHAECKA